MLQGISCTMAQIMNAYKIQIFQPPLHETPGIHDAPSFPLAPILAIMNTTLCDFRYDTVGSLEEAKLYLTTVERQESWDDLVGKYCGEGHNLDWIYSMEVMQCGLEMDPGKRKRKQKHRNIFI